MFTLYKHKKGLLNFLFSCFKKIQLNNIFLPWLTQQYHFNRKMEIFLSAFGLSSLPCTVMQFTRMCAHVKDIQLKPELEANFIRPALLETSPPSQTLDSTIICLNCSNDDARKFDTTTDTAELVCTLCGTVAVDHMLYEQIAERDFVDDDSEVSNIHTNFPSKYGYLMSDSYELETYVQGNAKVRNCRQEGELNRASTSTACKDRQKQAAIRLLENLGQQLGVSQFAISDAIELFAKIRNKKERMMNSMMQLAACLFVTNESQKRKIIKSQLSDDDGSVTCKYCSKALLHIPARAKHMSESPACRMLARKAECASNTRRQLSDLKIMSFPGIKNIEIK